MRRFVSKNKIMLLFITVLIFLALILFNFSKIGSKKTENFITIASKPLTEQYILAEMIAQLIEAKTNLKVKKELGIGGGTANLHPALLKGDIDIYPEYTGTGLLYVLKRNPINKNEKVYKIVKDDYLRKFNIKWLGLYGFNNTYVLAVKKSTANKYKLKNYSDLSKISKKLIFGAEYDFFEREDGFNGLTDKYKLKFNSTKEMDIGLKYDAIKSNGVDVINAFSTDGLLKKYNLKLLKDDKNFFNDYHAATLIRNETLKKYPKLENILNKLTGQISDEEMRNLNYQVESERKDPADVAKQFLKGKGIL